MQLDVIQKISALLTAAFGLVAALAWNGAIQTIFKEIFGDSSTILAMLIYAVVVTIIAVFVTIRIGKTEAKIREQHERKHVVTEV